MKHAIVHKLRKVLDSGVDSEYKVCYVLVECRKLLQKYERRDLPFALLLYCNWALHVDLERPGTTLGFLTRVDAFVSSVLGNPNLVLEYHVFREFVFLEAFRAQLGELLAHHGLPTMICETDDLWHEFVTHYAGIIEDGSLSCDAKNAPLKWVKQVIFTKGRNLPDSRLPFELCWNIELLDGRSIGVRVHAPNTPLEMIVHGIDFKAACLPEKNLC